MEYLARYNKVWQKKGTNTPLKNKLVLKKDEKISDFRQVEKPKEDEIFAKIEPLEEVREQRNKKKSYFEPEKNTDKKGVL